LPKISPSKSLKFFFGTFIKCKGVFSCTDLPSFHFANFADLKKEMVFQLKCWSSLRKGHWVQQGFQAFLIFWSRGGTLFAKLKVCCRSLRLIWKSASHTAQPKEEEPRLSLLLFLYFFSSNNIFPSKRIYYIRESLVEIFWGDLWTKLFFLSMLGFIWNATDFPGGNFKNEHLYKWFWKGKNPMSLWG